MDSLLVTTDEAAAYLRVSPKTIRRIAKIGELPVCRVGRAVRFRRDDLDGYAARLVEREAAKRAPVGSYWELGPTTRQSGRAGRSRNDGPTVVNGIRKIPVDCD